MGIAENMKVLESVQLSMDLVMVSIYRIPTEAGPANQRVGLRDEATALAEYHRDFSSWQHSYLASLALSEADHEEESHTYSLC